MVSGNSDLRSVGLKPNLAYRKNIHQVFMLNNYEMVKSAGNSIINKGFSHLRYNYRQHSHWVWELFIQGEFNRSQNLDQRLLLGGGTRFPFTMKHITLALGITPMHEREKESISGQTTVRNRISSYFSAKLDREKLKFTNTLYFQPAIETIHDFRILDEGKIDFIYTNNLAFSTGLRYRYDNVPPSGIKSYDLEIRNGLTVIF